MASNLAPGGISYNKGGAQVKGEVHHCSGKGWGASLPG